MVGFASCKPADALVIPSYGSMVEIFSLLWRNKFLVTLFWYTVWPTAVKFGMITGIGA